MYNKVDSIKFLISQRAKRYNIGFNTVGIAAEWNPRLGIKHLSNFGNFDEIIAGNNWTNNGVIKYIGEMGYESSTPQIILTFRTYTDYIHTKVTNERKIANYKGLNNILRWAENDAPLPKKFIQEIK